MDATAIDTTIGERLHLLMWQRRLSQTDAARRLGISQSALSRSLRGQRNWRVGEVVELAAMLNEPLQVATSPDPRDGIFRGMNDSQKSHILDEPSLSCPMVTRLVVPSTSGRSDHPLPGYASAPVTIAAPGRWTVA